MPPIASQRPLEKKLDPSNVVVSSFLDDIPVDTWEDAAASLLEKGVATSK